MGDRAKRVAISLAIYGIVEAAVLAVFVALVALMGGLSGLAAGIGIGGLIAVLSIPGGVLSSMAIVVAGRRLSAAAIGAAAISALAMAATTALLIANQPPPLYSDPLPLFALFVVVAGFTGFLAGALATRTLGWAGQT